MYGTQTCVYLFKNKNTHTHSLIAKVDCRKINNYYTNRRPLNHAFLLGHDLHATAYRKIEDLTFEFDGE